MYPKTHITLGFFFSLILLILFPDSIGLKGAVIIWLASFLIDVDHYLYYVYKRKDISLNKAFKWFSTKTQKFRHLSRNERRKKAKAAPCLLHGIEPMILLILLSFPFPILIFVIIGFIFHEILDAISIFYWGFDINHIGFQTLNILREVNGKT